MGSIKILGFALVAMLVLSGFAVAPASAQEPAIRSDGPVTLSATETGASEANGFTMFGESIRCPGSTYTGHKATATPHELIASGATAATITPAYNQASNNCKHSPENLPATIDLNGCDYVVNIGAETAADKYAATTDVVCPEGQSIKLTVFSGSGHSFKLCTYTIKAQTGLTGLTSRTTTSSGDFDLEGAASGVHVVRSGAVCEETTTTEGKISLDLTVKGLNGKGGSTSVVIGTQDLQPFAIRSNGPVTLNATETGEPEDNSFTTFGGQFHCPGSTYTGHKSSATPHELIPNGSTAATITPTYKNCTMKDAGGSTFSSTVDMNGCDYEIGIGGEISEHKYAVTTGIGCPEGTNVQLTLFSSGSHALRVCTLTIKAQTLTGLYATSTTPPAGDFDLEGTLTGVHVAKSGLCGSSTEGEGKIDLDLTVKGLDGEEKATAVAIDDQDLPPAPGISSDGPVTLIATETGAATANSFTVFGGQFNCPGSTYTGHKSSATPHDLIPSGVTAVTVTPAYKNCAMMDAGGNKFSSTFDMNGCDYEVSIGGEVSEHEYAATTDIVCPEGKSIQLTQFSSGAHSLRLCTLTLTAQTFSGLKAIGTTTATEDFDLEGTLTGLHVDKSGLCGSGTDSGAAIDLDLTVRGFNGEAVETGVTIGV